MTRPSPIPAPDRYQIANLNALYLWEEKTGPTRGWRANLRRRARHILWRLLYRQEQFNAAVVDHLNRNDAIGLEAHLATVQMLSWMDGMEQALASHELAADVLRRHREGMLAREQRANVAVATLAAAHDELRAAVGALQHATHSLKREVERLSGAGRASEVSRAGLQTRQVSGPIETGSVAESSKYVGFEDQFRGSQEDIRARLSDYLPVFAGASDVLDIGCGRGEFLALLRSQGISARGVDVNRAMVEVCQQQGLDATESDALSYLKSVPDGSLGGLIAAQVVEHLEPQYLNDLLDTAFAKLRPGAPIVLETINPACWFAFFESYIRDVTHVRPLHPDTLKYLLVATGFQRVDIRYRAPYPEADKLQGVVDGGTPSLTDWAETINANVEKINSLLFTWLDYAAIGHRP